MAERKMRKCAVCRKEYKFCPRCGEDANKPSWYFTFCSSNCKDIYDTTSQFENNWITANDARKILDNLDLSDIENFGQSYKNSVAKINLSIADAITEDAVIETGKAEDSLNEEQSSANESVSNKTRKRTKKNIE